MEEPEQSVAYKCCTIFYSTRLDTDLLKFIPNVAIAWETNGNLITCFLRSFNPEPTKDKAESAALEQAKAWIDRVKPTLA